MADRDTVLAALGQAADLLGGADDDVRRRIPERTVSAYLTDLDLAFAGRLSEGYLVDVVEIDPARRRDAQLRLTLSSDDLVDVVAGRLNFAHAWVRGRIKVDARLRDVLALRAFL
jgi:hypothetical protein